MTGGRCWYCGAEATTIDHAIPLALQGGNNPTNLVPACVKCNNDKDDLTLNNYRYVVGRFAADVHGWQRLNYDAILLEKMNMTTEKENETKSDLVVMGRDAEAMMLSEQQKQIETKPDDIKQV